MLVRELKLSYNAMFKEEMYLKILRNKEYSVKEKS
jgi:hypothetical protein